MLRDAFTYPIRSGGWITILIGAVFALILDFLQMAPLVGIAVTIFAAGYFGSFYLSIVGGTMTENDRLPDWPSFTDFWDDILHPIVRLVGPVIVSFGPAIGIDLLMDEESAYFLPSIIAAVVFGCIYFPMAVLATSAFGGILAASPHIVMPGVIRCMPEYLLAVITLVLVFGLAVVVEEFATQIPYVGWFLAALISLYSLIFQARLIGLVFRTKRDALGWC